MENLQIDQPKEIITTITAICKNCGTTWDAARVVERADENGQLVEEENSAVVKCPTCNPNPVGPAAEGVEVPGSIDYDEPVNPPVEG